MKRTALATLLLTLPVAVLALDFQHSDDDYSDATTFSVAERAAISVLTDVGAVSGNPDGSFAQGRTLNRAEFTKIALLSMDVGVGEGDSRVCFPDVPESVWYSRYVCRAEIDGIVKGNPDGLFHPEREVNYAEAVKILVELAGYTLPEPPENERWAWYRAYILAAEEHGVALPASTDPGHELTRGQMARLAAAFVAETHGELEAYRRAERGQFGDVSSSSSVSSASSESSASSASSVSSSSSSVSSSLSRPLYPAVNSFLVAGRRTPLILGGTILSTEETGDLRFAYLTLRREITSIDRMFLVDANGVEITELKLATSNNTDFRRWESIAPDSTFQFPLNVPVKVGIVFDLDPIGGGGSSNQLIEIESFSIQAEGIGTGNTKQLLLQDQLYPMHQTAFGRITKARSVLPVEGTVQAGAQRPIASFLFTADTATGASLYLKGAEFLLGTTNVNVSNIRIGDAASGELADCGLEKLEVTRIVCSAMHENHSWIPAAGLVVTVYADVALSGTANGQLIIGAENRGRIGDAGSFVWSDDSGQFNWIEEDVPFGGDVTWTVTP